MNAAAALAALVGAARDAFGERAELKQFEAQARQVLYAALGNWSPLGIAGLLLAAETTVALAMITYGGALFGIHVPEVPLAWVARFILLGAMFGIETKDAVKAYLEGKKKP